MNASIVGLWAEILRQLPTARMMIKRHGLSDRLAAATAGAVCRARYSAGAIGTA